VFPVSYGLHSCILLRWKSVLTVVHESQSRETVKYDHYSNGIQNLQVGCRGPEFLATDPEARVL
jgi:hypothetical protein